LIAEEQATNSLRAVKKVGRDLGEVPRWGPYDGHGRGPSERDL
jgi:hypothetical protein